MNSWTLAFIVGMTVLAALAAPNPLAAQSQAPSCYSSLLSGTPQTLSAYIESVNSDGTVEVNGVDTAQPTMPFQFVWGDGNTSTAGFPAQHQYTSTSQNYVIIVTATENNGTTQQFSFPVFFIAPPISPQSLPGVSFQIPSQLPTLQSHWSGYTPPTGVTAFSDSSFPVYSSSDVAYVLGAISSIDYNFANNNSFLLNGVFQIDMLENTGTNPDAGLSFWYTTPMSVGYASSVLVGPSFPPITWYVLFNEIGKDTTLNTPLSLTYGGNTDGPASEIYSETMGDIFSYAAGCQLISNAASYGIGADAKLDIQNTMLSGAALLQATFNQYVANGAPFSSWNPGNVSPDPTIGTFSTLAWKFIEHAELQEQGYQIPVNRLMSFLQMFNASMLASYAPQSNTEAAATFRSTLMVTALSYAFSQDLRSEFTSLNFPIDNETFEQLYGMATGGGASLLPATANFAAQDAGSTSTGQTFTLINYLLTPISISASFSGTNPTDFPVQASSTCPYPTGTLAANSRCTYVIAFAPSLSGAESSTFGVADVAQDVTQPLANSPQSVSLTGTGIASSVSLSETSLSFPPQLEGTVSAAHPVVLGNNGTASLSITSIAVTGTNSGDFAETNNCGASVAAGANCTVSVTFKPAAAGARTAAIMITDNAVNSPQAIALSGTTAAFSLGVASSGSTSAIVTAGQTATYSLQVNPISSFAGTVNLTCSGAPATTDCSIPSSVSLSGTTAVPFTLSVSTTARSAAPVFGFPNSAPKARYRLYLPEAMLLGFLTIIFLRFRKIRLSVITATTVVLLLAGCGGGNTGNGSSGGSGGTPAGNYTLVVTGNSQGVNSTLDLTLTVQ